MHFLHINVNSLLSKVDKLRDFVGHTKRNLKETEVYFLGDFNINVLVNDKFVLKENQSLDFGNLNCALMSKYKELCQTFPLKEITQEPTCITGTSSSLLDHILTNAGWKISQKGVIDVGLSDHQLIYCTQNFKDQGKYA